MKEKFKNQKGITLIALIITIIVLLILAMVSIKLIIDKGIISFANISKEETIIAGEKEKITLAYDEYKMSKINNPNYTMQEALNIQKAEATADGNEILGWNITFEKTKHQYTLSGGGVIDDGIADRWDGVTKEIPQIAENNSWHIYNSAQMKYFADFVNGKLTEEEKGNRTITQETIVYLEADLDLGARANEKGEKQVGTEWTPVGETTAQKFIGTFEGNNHRISGVYVNIDGNFGGIFGNSNTIKNLTIKDSYVQAINASGGIVGALRTGTIENCHNINTRVEIEDTSVGGIVGQLSSNANTKAINCTNTGNIYGKGERVGGIVGAANTLSSINNCINSGEVNGNGNYIGGITGYAGTSAIISNCSNNGEITGSGNYTGGVAGYANTSVTISNCTNSRKVNGTGQYVGGIVGAANTYTSILECKNNAKISSASEKVNDDPMLVGGIVGNFLGTKIEKCINLGDVLSKSSYKWNRAGGIAGWIGNNSDKSRIEECANYGNVTAEGISTYMCVVGRNCSRL